MTGLTRILLSAFILLPIVSLAQDEPPSSQPTDPPKEEPADEPPADEPPADEPPADEPPTDEPPADEPPADEPPVDEPPADEPPADEPPADQPPIDEPVPTDEDLPEIAPPDEKLPDEDFADPRRDATVRVVEMVQPAVAHLSSLPRSGRKASLGSGVVIDPAGYVLTNAHVVERARTLLVTLPESKHFEADVLALLPEYDIALLRLEAAGQSLPYVKLAAPGDLLIGETCIALGNPFGLENTVTRGVISARNRRIRAGKQHLLGGFLQTDAAINPGNSGGPLVNLNGELIGLNTAIHATGSGIGFAIPAKRVRKLLITLSDPLKVRGVYLGVRVEDAPDDRGARVTRVTPGSPADIAGLQPGDTITTAGPVLVVSAFTFNQAFLGKKRPSSMRLSVVGTDGRRRGAVLNGFQPPWREKIYKRTGIVARDVTPALAWRLRLRSRTGVVVRQVAKGSPAARLGLTKGDVIRKMARRPRKRPRKRIPIVPIPNQRAMSRFLSQSESGESVLVTIRRGKQDFWGELTLR